MKKIIFLLFIVCQTVFPQNGWDLIYSFSDFVSSVFFNDPLNGFAPPAPSGIYKTTDGGLSWEILNIPNLNNPIRKIIAIDKDNLIGVGQGGTIIKSVNEGNTWEVKNIGSTDNLTSICSTPDGKLFVWSNERNIYRSVDQGENWSVYSLDTLLFPLTDISFADKNIGFGVGYYETSIKTTDGGESWFTILPIIPGRSMFAVQFLNDSVGFVIGGEQIVKTSNGGINWFIKYNSGGLQLNDVSFCTDNIGWVVGTDKIVKTTDIGEHWTQQNFSPNHYLLSVECVDSLICFATGGEGALYKTTNGGITFVRNNSGGTSLNYSLEQNYPNPFNPSTTICYQIPKAGFVSLKVYDVLGKVVATLVDEEKPAGSYEVEFNTNMGKFSSPLPSGIYFYWLEAGGNIFTKKLIILK